MDFQKPVRGKFIFKFKLDKNGQLERLLEITKLNKLGIENSKEKINPDTFGDEVLNLIKQRYDYFKYGDGVGIYAGTFKKNRERILLIENTSAGSRAEITYKVDHIINR